MGDCKGWLCKEKGEREGEDGGMRQYPQWGAFVTPPEADWTTLAAGITCTLEAELLQF